MVTLSSDIKSIIAPVTDKNLLLVIDIHGCDIDTLQGKDPTEVYIITTQGLDALQDFLMLGYYNLLYGVESKDITQAMVDNFIETGYKDNKIAVILNNLGPLYKEHGNIIRCIEATLRAIREQNLEEFTKNIKFNLEPMEAAMQDINVMYLLASELLEMKDSLQEEQQTSEQQKATIAAANEIHSQVSELRTKLINAESDVDVLKEKLAEAQKELAASSSKELDPDTIKETLIYRTLQDTYTKLQETCREHESTIMKLKVAAGIGADGEEGGPDEDPKDRIIRSLKQEVYDLKNMTYIEQLTKQLPAITNNVNMDAELILYLKQIRPTIYINSAVFFLERYIERININKQREFLIIILDPLQSQFDILKYKKRGWAINNLPNTKSRVVVTNDVSLAFLRDQLHIDKYQLIVVFDRLGVTVDTIDTKVVQRFYLINTPNDIQDYKLDAARCIGFYTPIENDGMACRYYISPDGALLGTSDTRKRAFKTTKDSVWLDIFNSLGLTENG